MTPEQIAAGLSKAQKKVVLTKDDEFVIGHKGKWAFMTRTTARILYELGLIEHPWTLVRPTELGLAVRKILENGNDAC